MSLKSATISRSVITAGSSIKQAADNSENTNIRKRLVQYKLRKVTRTYVKAIFDRRNPTHKTMNNARDDDYTSRTNQPT